MFSHDRALIQCFSRERTNDVTLDYAQPRDIQTTGPPGALPVDITLGALTTATASHMSGNKIEARFSGSPEKMAAFKAEVNTLAQKLGRPVSDELHAGDSGVYRGSVNIARQRFGLMEQGEGVKLVDYTQCRGLTIGEKFSLKRAVDSDGRAILKTQSVLKSKERSLEIEF